jgi:hypothetical protein
MANDIVVKVEAACSSEKMVQVQPKDYRAQ